MRSNRLLVGVTCGVALALGVLAAVDAGTQTAGADANVTEDQLWVSLNDNGVISYQSRAQDDPNKFESARLTNQLPGIYVVDFNRSVLGCSWSATPRDTRHRFAVTAPVPGDPMKIGVYVYTVPTVVRPGAQPSPQPPPSPAPTSDSQPVLIDSFVDVQVLC